MTPGESINCPSPHVKGRAASGTRTLKVTISAPLRMLVVADAIKQLIAENGIEIDPDALDLIQSLSVLDLQSVVESEHTLTVELNLTKLVDMLQQKHKPGSLSIEQCLEYFMRNGASIPLIHRVFKRPKREIVRIFHEMSLDQERQKAVRLPAARERDAIHRAWNALPEHGMRGYVELHRQFSHWPLATLERVLNEFKE
uniref:hypothetical protein n=1 Tax=Burkholderia arboris TaxID=488730 RepID=UPI003BEF2EBE